MLNRAEKSSSFKPYTCVPPDSIGRIVDEILPYNIDTNHRCDTYAIACTRVTSIV